MLPKDEEIKLIKASDMITKSFATIKFNEMCDNICDNIYMK